MFAYIITSSLYDVFCANLSAGKIFNMLINKKVIFLLGVSSSTFEKIIFIQETIDLEFIYMKTNINPTTVIKLSFALLWCD